MCGPLKNTKPIHHCDLVVRAHVKMMYHAIFEEPFLLISGGTPLENATPVESSNIRTTGALEEGNNAAASKERVFARQLVSLSQHT